MKNVIYLLLASLLVCTNIYAQINPFRNFAFDFSINDDDALSVMSVDTGFIFVESKAQLQRAPGFNNSFPTVFRFDMRGNCLDTIVYPQHQNNEYGFVLTNENKLIHIRNNFVNVRFISSKFEANRVIEEDTVLQNPITSNSLIKALPDRTGGFYLLSSRTINSSGNIILRRNVLLMRLDRNYRVLWFRELVRNSTSIPLTSFNFNDSLNPILAVAQQDTVRGYVIDKDSGNVISERVLYIDTIPDEFPYDLNYIQSGNGYFFSARTKSRPLTPDSLSSVGRYFSSADSNATILWQSNYGQAIVKTTPMDNGDIILFRERGSFASLVRINALTGNQISSIDIPNTSPQGTTNYFARDILPFSNGDAILVGYARRGGFVGNGLYFGYMRNFGLVSNNPYPALFNGIINSASELLNDTKIKWKVYPNPSRGTFLSDKAGYLQIFNALGARVFAQNIEEGQALELSHLSRGLYVVKLSNKEGQYTQKWVRE